MDGYRVEESRRAFKGRLSTVRVDQVRMPDGSVAEREIVEHPGAVAVVAVDDDGRVVLLRQYRHALGEYVVEVPAGKLDRDGEPPEDTARRELIEEVGLDAADLTTSSISITRRGGPTSRRPSTWAPGCARLRPKGSPPRRRRRTWRCSAFRCTRPS